MRLDGSTVATYCQATLNYHDGVAAVPTVVDVRDGREAGDLIDFERCGFQRVDAPSAVADWSDLSIVDRVGRPEFERFAVEFSGCDIAIGLPLIARSRRAAEAVADYGPIEFVHSDFTDDYGPMVTEPGRPYRQFLDPLLADRGLARTDLVDASRLAVLQAWRSVGPIEVDYPLAVCDASSIGEHRLKRQVISHYGGRRLDFEIFTVRPPGDGDDDRWYTYPRLGHDEALLIRTYDSERAANGLPFWTPHSAFRDPHVPDGPEHRRESVELRAICAWL